MKKNLRIAVLLPCYNESATIGEVVQSFKQVLPNATIYVYDNNSTDNTTSIATQAGAIVQQELQRGKGNVVKRMFATVDADVYVLADGDGTYDATMAPTMIKTLCEKQLDMVVGTRVDSTTPQRQETYRRGHRLGNRLFNSIVRFCFGKKFNDIFSGYRVFSRCFVKSFPATSEGFDIETEMAIHCLELGLPTLEIPTKYAARPSGSNSKLNTYRDGMKILWRIVLLLKEVRPLFFFGSLFCLFLLAAIVLFIPVLLTYLQTDLVPRIPTTVLSMGLTLLAFLSLACGLILDNISRHHRAVKRLFYLSQSCDMPDVASS